MIMRISRLAMFRMDPFADDEDEVEPRPAFAADGGADSGPRNRPRQAV